MWFKRMSIILSIFFFSGCGSFYASGMIAWGEFQEIETSLKISQGRQEEFPIVHITSQDEKGENKEENKELIK